MNYIGSKYSLLDFIHSVIFEVTGYKVGDPFVFGDLFAGTGVVGASFRSSGCKVIANDLQYYSYAINKQLIENDENVDDGLIDFFNSLPGKEGFIYKNYCLGSGSGRNYFSDKNGKKCDAIRDKLEELFLSGKINIDSYYFYLASLINSIDKYANTASVYAAFLKHMKRSASKPFILEPCKKITGPKGMVYNEDINTLITKIEGDVLYLDPPYNARQYNSNYHLLETIARNDSPEIFGVTGLRHDDKKSDFCSSKKVERAFEYLISNANFKYIFLSYNNEGLMPLGAIKNIMCKYGEYSFYTKKYKRFKSDRDSNRNISGNETIEYLHCLKKSKKGYQK